MLGIGFACTVLDFVAEPIEIVMKKLCGMGKAAVLIILVDVAEDIHYCGVLAAIVRELIGVIQELHKQKSHGYLVDIALICGIVNKSPDEVFYKILHGENA